MSGRPAGGPGLQAGDCGSQLASPGPSVGAETQAAATAGEPPGGGEQAQTEPFRFPSAAGRPGQGEELGPGQ